MAQSQIASTSSTEQQVPMQMAALGPAAPVPAPAPDAITETSPREVSVDPEAAERLKRLEDGIKELLQWKQDAASAPMQPAATQFQPHWNGSGSEAEDISPRRVPTPPPPPAAPTETASQSIGDGHYYYQQQPVPAASTNPLQRQPSNNLTASAAAAATSSIPLSTNLHPRSVSNTPPRSPPALASPHKHPSNPQNAPSSPAIRRQFLKELSHEAVGHERPGVISRFPHPLSDLRAVRQELQSELESELVSELAAQGIHDPEGCRGLSPAEYLSCMEALQQRRAAAANQMNEQDKAREQYMRKSVTMHVDAVTKSVAAATKTQSPPPLPLPPQTGPILRPTILRIKTTATPPPVRTTTIPIAHNSSMELSPFDFAMLEVRDQETDAFYSPLRRGHSINDDGALPGTPGTPSRSKQIKTQV